jgi:hypothetical protein
MKYSANFIDYLDFLIGLKYETITKIANKIEKFLAEIIRRKKKYLWFRFPTDPIFFCRPYFFNAIDRATLFSPGGCGLLPKWRLLSH